LPAPLDPLAQTGRACRPAPMDLPITKSVPASGLRRPARPYHGLDVAQVCRTVPTAGQKLRGHDDR